MGRPKADDEHFLLTALVLVAEAAPSLSFKRDKAFELVRRVSQPFDISDAQLKTVFQGLLECAPRWSPGKPKDITAPASHAAAVDALSKLINSSVDAGNVGKTLRTFIGLMGRPVTDDARHSGKYSLADAIFITGIADHDYRSKIKK